MTLGEGRWGSISRRDVLRSLAGIAAAVPAVSIAPAALAAEPDAVEGASRREGERIARFALRYKGTRYVSGGNSPKGFDCSGFTQFVVRKTVGIDIGQSVPPQWRFGDRVAKGRWRAGDLVFFENTFGRGLTHVGIYLDNDRFIHAENERTGVVISRIDSDYYAKHYYGARRLV